MEQPSCYCADCHIVLKQLQNVYTSPDISHTDAHTHASVFSPALRNESQRPSAVEALNHPWLLGVDEDGQDGGVVLVGSVGSVGSMGSVGSFESLDAASLVGAPNPAKLFGPSSQPLGDTLVQRLQRYGGYSKLKKVDVLWGLCTHAGGGAALASGRGEE